MNTVPRCKVAVIGAGSMAREHLRAFAAVPGVELAGIHSRTRAKAEALAAEFKIGCVCDSVAELHSRTRAELVVVTVFETAMRAVTEAACEFPWTLLLEKPPGADLAEAEAILAAAAARQRRVFVALNRRFLSSSRAAAAALASQPGPRYIHVQDQQSLDTARAIGHPERVVANWMFANSIHLVDYLRFLGRGRITGIEHGARWTPEKPFMVLAQVRFESGDLGCYEGVWHGPGPWAVQVTTADKRWEMRPLEQAVFQTAGTRQLQPVPVHDWDREFKPGFRLQAEHAAAAALNQPSEAVPLAEALETMRLIHAIFAP